MDKQKSVAKVILKDGVFSGIFAGWGESRVIAMNYKTTGNVVVCADTNIGDVTKESSSDRKVKHAKLNTLLSVSIAGCDLMGSALYTAGTCFSVSGKFAPIGLFLVTCMLFLYRKVYSEVVTAFPVNGGSYNLMLNTTSKKVAGFVACLSILSYIATAILSAFDAVIYISDVWTDIDIRLWSVLILLIFGAITICGVQESSTVSCIMFCVHVFTLTLLILWGFAYGIQDNFETFSQNIHTRAPEIVSSTGLQLARHNPIAAIFFGYSAGLLGITGFETASNYVEDLESTKTFVKTVNWMWFLSGIYNPLLSIIAMMVIPMEVIYDNPSNMLAKVAHQLGGSQFSTFLSLDAGFVLCGGVLTALVGVSGLLSRLAKDQILPELFSYTNSRGSNYIGIIIFVGLSISLLLAIFDPEDPKGIHDFGGVFAISFLSVLTAFAGGAILLKLYRPHIARLVIAKWWDIIISGIAVIAGLVGNIVLTPDIFYIFLGYLGGLLFVVSYMFYRVEILSFGIWIIRRVWMNEEKRKKEQLNDEEIISACLKQDEYDEDDQIQNMIFDYKQLRASVRRSIHSLIGNQGVAEESYEFSPVKQEETTDLIELTHLETNSSKSLGMTPIQPPKNRHHFFHLDSFQRIEKETKENNHEDQEGDHKNNHDNSMNRSPERLKRDFTKKIRSSATEFFEMIDLATQQMIEKYSPLRYYDRNSSNSINEIELLLQKPFIGWYLSYLMTSLDDLLSIPFVYLAKHSDPISLQLALQYIENNELTNKIIILHFVDDRKVITANHEYEEQIQIRDDSSSSPRNQSSRQRHEDSNQYDGINSGDNNSRDERKKSFRIPENGFLLNIFTKSAATLTTSTDTRSQPVYSDKEKGKIHEPSPSFPRSTEQQTISIASQFTLDSSFPSLPYETQELLHNVAILDAFYTYKKIHAVVVRGGFFSPSSLDCVANYLGLMKNCMIMGVPDVKFPFPFSRLNGCRIAVPDADPIVRQNASAHLRSIFVTVEQRNLLSQKIKSI